MIIPTVQIAIKIPSSLGLMAFFNIIIEGRLKVVTPIIKESGKASTYIINSYLSTIIYCLILHKIQQSVLLKFVPLFVISYFFHNPCKLQYS